MKNRVVRFVLALVTLIAGAACEELLPKVLGVGFPLLLASVVCFAPRASVALPVLVALAGGALEDGLSGLPPVTSASYFLFVAAVVRITRLPLVIGPFAFPVYQLWLCLWVSGLSGSVFTRILMSFPCGLLTLGFVWVALGYLERKAAVDEEG